VVKLRYARLLGPGLLLFLAACGGAGILVGEPAQEHAGEIAPLLPAQEKRAELAAQSPATPTGTATPLPATATPEQPTVTPEQPAAAAQAEPAGEQVMPEEATVARPGPTEAQQQLLASLVDSGPAPELFNEVWLNSGPLKLADLHGKVVIVEFWTFG
jgi:hypothetical protein